MADYKDVKYNVDYSDTSGAGGLIRLATNHQATTDGDDDRGAIGGYMYLFNPSSTVFEKHFIMKMGGTANSGGAHYTELYEGAGYFQQTAAITRIRFKYNGGSRIDGGRITMYGLVK